VPLPVIGRLLGHTLPQTTARYAHVSDEAAKEAANRVGKLVTSLTDAKPHLVDVKKA
jgi:integrase